MTHCITWLDLNSSYSHSSLALPAIEANESRWNRGEKWSWNRVSCTLKNEIDEVVNQLVETHADVVCATAWLFTVDRLMELLEHYSRLCPEVKILLGGPEFLGHNEAFLRRYPFVSGVFRGEGEEGFFEWMQRIDRPAEWTDVKGVCYLQNHQYKDGGRAVVGEFAHLTPPSSSRFFPWNKPFVQFETDRGCYNTCTFCVSGNDHRSVDTLTIEQIHQQLSLFADRGIREIRLLDRTFNSRPRRAVRLLQLFASFHGRLSFHLEIHPALLNAELQTQLKQLPHGLLHLEAGIQSLNPKSIEEVCRKGNVERAVKGLEFLFSLPTMETHVDLIVGLPLYTYEELEQDARQLMVMGAGELQIELLKLLPGTILRLEAANRGMDFNPAPPYEVLQTPHMTSGEVNKAMTLSRVVDIFYNDPLLQSYFRSLAATNDRFLHDFIGWSHANSHFNQPQSKTARMKQLLNYVQQFYPQHLTQGIIGWLRAGLPLFGIPYGKVEKRKKELPNTIEIVYGQYVQGQRLYCYESEETTLIVGYDRAISQSRPQFIGRVPSLPRS